jgi:anaerobic selenocysteine-containing dehydrogenase
MEAIQSPMVFGNESIDQPGKSVAKGLHGVWQAPGNGWVEPEVILVIGMNPLVSHNGFPFGNPNTWINGRLAKGMKLIFIDPRRTESARKATQFIQPLPGHDAALLAALCRVVIDEKLYDSAFVAENVQGLAELRRALERFTPEAVAAAAGIDAGELVTAARTYASARRGYAICGTGPSMSGSSTLVEYMRMCLETLCGHYLREGEALPFAGVTMAPPPARAQATPPFPAWGAAFGGHETRVRGLRAYYAGSAPMPTSALPDEILMPGEGRVRALLVCAGNPVLAWPDQNRTVAALKDLELSVAIVAPPAGSQVVEEWEVFYGLCRRLGLPFTLHGLNGTAATIDTDRKPTTDELLEVFMAGSRIPLDELKRHPHGALFPDEAARAAARGRLDRPPRTCPPRHHRDLDAYPLAGDGVGEGFEFRMISRRVRHTFNSIARNPATRVVPYNPAFMHPDDMARYGLADGDVIELRSRYGAILGVAEGDPALRPGLVSMAHGYGAAPDRDDALFAIGSPTSRLSGLDDDPERHSGQPRMSGIPVNIRAVNALQAPVQPDGAQHIPA